MCAFLVGASSYFVNGVLNLTWWKLNYCINWHYFTFFLIISMHCSLFGIDVFVQFYMLEPSVIKSSDIRATGGMSILTFCFEQASSDHYSIGLKMLNQLVSEMNQVSHCQDSLFEKMIIIFLWGFMICTPSKNCSSLQFSPNLDYWLHYFSLVVIFHCVWIWMRNHVGQNYFNNIYVICRPGPCLMDQVGPGLDTKLYIYLFSYIINIACIFALTLCNNINLIVLVENINLIVISIILMMG